MKKKKKYCIATKSLFELIPGIFGAMEQENIGKKLE